jgi:transcription elongation factor GreA-like protein
MSDVPWALHILFESFDGTCFNEADQEGTVSRTLSDSQWTTWSRTAKGILMTDEHYDVSPETDAFILRPTPVTYDEKQLSIFNSHEKFNDKVKDLKKFLIDKGEYGRETFYAMIQYFSQILEARKDQSSGSGDNGFLPVVGRPAEPEEVHLHQDSAGSQFFLADQGLHDGQVRCVVQEASTILT